MAARPAGAAALDFFLAEVDAPAVVAAGFEAEAEESAAAVAAFGGTASLRGDFEAPAAAAVGDASASGSGDSNDALCLRPVAAGSGRSALGLMGPSVVSSPSEPVANSFSSPSMRVTFARRPVLAPDLWMEARATAVEATGASAAPEGRAVAGDAFVLARFTGTATAGEATAAGAAVAAAGTAAARSGDAGCDDRLFGEAASTLRGELEPLVDASAIKRGPAPEPPVVLRPGVTIGDTGALAGETVRDARFGDSCFASSSSRVARATCAGGLGVTLL